MSTATSLLAEPTGTERCFYCGNPANTVLVLSSSFTAWWEVMHPESDAVCEGCRWMLDEKRKIAGKEKLQKTRNYSWLIEKNKQTPYTKAHKKTIKEILLSPPSPPWAFAIAESGQKHLLFLTPINVSSDEPFTIQLENIQIGYTRDALAARLGLASQAVLGVGHKGATSITTGMAIKCGAEFIEQWEKVLTEPLTQLALFLTPSQKELKNDRKS